MAQCKYPTPCAGQTNRTICKPQCMAVCEQTRRRCKNLATKGFDTSNWPAIGKKAVQEAFAEAGVPVRYGCCSFCELHSEIVRKEYVNCAKGVCRKLWENVPSRQNMLLMALPTIMSQLPVALGWAGDIQSGEWGDSGFKFGDFGTLASTGAAFEEGTLAQYTSTAQAHTTDCCYKKRKRKKSVKKKSKKRRTK